MTINQISIFIENRKNALSELTNVLATHNINIRAMSLADSSDFGIARLIVDNTQQVQGAWNTCTALPAASRVRLT